MEAASNDVDAACGSSCKATTPAPHGSGRVACKVVAKSLRGKQNRFFFFAFFGVPESLKIRFHAFFRISCLLLPILVASTGELPNVTWHQSCRPPLQQFCLRCCTFALRPLLALPHSFFCLQLPIAVMSVGELHLAQRRM